MSKLLWGQVFYHDQFAGYLRQEPGNRVNFCYDEDYIDAGGTAIAFTLPIKRTPFLFIQL